MNSKQIQRNQTIADLYKNSDNISMQEIAYQYGISRERIRQIIEIIYPEYKRPNKIYLSKEEKREIKKRGRIELFWSKTKINETTGCLEWTGCSHPSLGYGIFGSRYITNSSTRYTHRITWIINFGQIPNNLKVLHKCDNPKCVNINHLYLGTQSDNIRDREDRFKGISPINRNKNKHPRRVVSNEILT